MARSRRFTHSVLLGFTTQMITMVTGLWLSPFLLGHLGKAAFGFWIVGQQLLTYVTLMDFGVVALLPRETAWATGRADPRTQVPEVVARTVRILLVQTPAVSAIAALLWFAAAASVPFLSRPIALAAIVFSLQFPFRIFRAILEGLQDLAYIGSTYMLGWAAGFIVSVSMVRAGWGLSALPAGWAAWQFTDGLLCFVRLRSRFRYAFPSAALIRSSVGIREHFSRSIWVSISQIAQVLIYGTDAAIIGRFFGVAAVVPYSSTGKLVNVLANQPQAIMRAAEPGLSEMRMKESRDRLSSVTGALSLAMLLSSGVVASFTIAANPSFVRWWMGAENFSGLLLTVLFALSMALRHLNITAIYTLYSVGQERFLAITSLADGILSTVLSIVLARWMHSAVGVVLGSILSTCAILSFGNAPRLARELSITPLALAKPLAGWFWRMLVAGAFAAALGAGFLGANLTALHLPIPGLIAAGINGALAVLFYGLLMFPVAIESPLQPYLAARWKAVRSLFVRQPEPFVERL